MSEADAPFDSVDDPLVAIDRDFTIRDLNAAAARLAGRPVEELRGRPCRELFRDADGVLCSCPLQEAVKKGVPTRGWIVDSGGRMWEVVCRPVPDGRGTLVVERFREVSESGAIST